MSHLLSLALAIVVGAAGAQLVRPLAAAPPSFTPFDLLGHPVPNVGVLTLEGDSTSAVAKGRPTLVIVARTVDCLSCSNFAFEIRLLRQRFPNLDVRLIGSGEGDSTFAEYFRKERITRHALRDPERRLIRALGASREPLTFLADSTGTIVFVDARSNIASAKFPIGRLLPLIAHASGLDTLPQIPQTTR